MKRPVTLSVLFLLIAFVLLVLAAVRTFGVWDGGPSALGLAFLGAAFWAGSGAMT